MQFSTMLWKREKFPFYKQPGNKDCGPTCLKIISKFYNKIITLKLIREYSETDRMGSSLYNLSSAAEKIGFRTLIAKIALEKLIKAPLPCILHWNNRHYIILYKIKKQKFYVADPAHGLLKYTKEQFLENWIGKNTDEEKAKGVVLLLEPTPSFYNSEYKLDNNKLGLSFLLKYLIKYKKFLFQLIYGLIAGSVLQLIFPFLTQSIIDVGIKNQNVHFVYLILFAQLSLFLGKTAIEVVRGWILLHLSSRINISLVSDFFIKLMNLPISFFDTRVTGDIMQRIHDHKKIEKILTTSSLSLLFSIVNLLIFTIVLAYYNLLIFNTFIIGSIFYYIWIVLFLKKRRDLNYKQFSQISQEQSKVIELVNGMQEIKLHNAEKQKRWSWEFIQARLFKISVQGLAIEQYQNVGSNVINEIKNIAITILSAILVINGEITLGMMLAITYIVGQLNSPINQLINFIREFQDAKISLERLSEIHDKEDEEPVELERIYELKNDNNIDIRNVSFKYIGSTHFVLRDFSLVIPSNKTTAIVGASGSGKTTLMKMLLKFYDPSVGEIRVGNYDMKSISPRAWRKKCGVVMQEGFIFNDSIANNITIGKENIDTRRLNTAAEVANIKSFIESMPFSYNTIIGTEGVGLSTGQKQRILIARAVYKNPNYIFFDEATSALDANNESVIMDNLTSFFQNKTVVVIAHRLSTVKNAHQIVVLDDGRITEIGTHSSLINKKGNYFQLIKNQLELGR